LRDQPRHRVALGALVFVDQSLPVGDRDLIIIGMNFAEARKPCRLPP